MIETLTHIHVQVTVSVSLGAPWTGAARLDDLHKQGAREGIEAIERLVRAGNDQWSERFEIVGAPHVLLVTTEKKR